MNNDGFSIYKMLGGERIVAVRLNGESEKTELIEETSEELRREEELIKSAEGIRGILTDLDSQKMFSITKDVTTIGSSTEADIIMLEHGQRTISRSHALLERKDGRFYLTDTSSNGTFIAKDDFGDITFYRLPKGEPVEIASGQTIKFAGKCMRFTIAEGAEDLD